MARKPSTIDVRPQVEGRGRPLLVLHAVTKGTLLSLMLFAERVRCPMAFLGVSAIHETVHRLMTA